MRYITAPLGTAELWDEPGSNSTCQSVLVQLCSLIPAGESPAQQSPAQLRMGLPAAGPSAQGNDHPKEIHHSDSSLTWSEADKPLNLFSKGNPGHSGIQ